ncbi:hypothetical protein PEC302110_33750 [Pectobacterium araliae]|uniref:Uncharacterized protein n=1 Tax=Pectobacterium araliae TaxID=3073862 RepID=A0AAN0MNB2_9GAMM|nr:hypothetical protein PEC302110_33750 [Pectobacterium sp. MAFF 302110]
MEYNDGKAIFYENSEQGKFTDVVVKEESISFDMNHYGDNYTVSLKKKYGSLFKGVALKNTLNDVRYEIPVTARVVKDSETGLIIISGTEWVENGKDWMWFAEISIG